MHINLHLPQGSTTAGKLQAVARSCSSALSYSNMYPSMQNNLMQTAMTLPQPECRGAILNAFLASNLQQVRVLSGEQRDRELDTATKDDIDSSVEKCNPTDTQQPRHFNIHTVVNHLVCMH